MKDSEETIRAKWLMDGATTLSEAADKLAGAAEDLRSRERDGWQLSAPVEDDYGFISKIATRREKEKELGGQRG